jgi:excisionase family DNA binding protein
VAAMDHATTRVRTPSPWMTIHEASALIGVSPATLRRWCDQGDVKAFTTPGGHRRFSRSAILGLVPAGRRTRPTLNSLGETPERIVDQVYHRNAPTIAKQAAMGADAVGDDLEPLRDLGRRVAVALIDHLEATDPAAAADALGAAEDLAAEHGRIAARRGMQMGTAVDAFLGFRAVFLRELCDAARTRDLDATETTELLEGANTAMDRLLGAFVRAHETTVSETGACTCTRGLGAGAPA